MSNQKLRWAERRVLRQPSFSLAPWHRVAAVLLSLLVRAAQTLELWECQLWEQSLRPQERSTRAVLSGALEWGGSSSPAIFLPGAQAFAMLFCQLNVSGLAEPPRRWDGRAHGRLGCRLGEMRVLEVGGQACRGVPIPLLPVSLEPGMLSQPRFPLLERSGFSLLCTAVPGAPSCAAGRWGVRGSAFRFSKVEPRFPVFRVQGKHRVKSTTQFLQHSAF